MWKASNLGIEILIARRAQEQGEEKNKGKWAKIKREVEGDRRWKKAGNDEIRRSAEDGKREVRSTPKMDRGTRLARTMPPRKASENHTSGSRVVNCSSIRLEVGGFAACIVSFIIA